MKGSVAVKPMNIVEVALDAGNLELFVQALQSSGIADLLATENEYTVFAPQDSAFKQFTSMTINELMQNKDELVTLLSYHIVPGKFPQASLKSQPSVQTLLGKELQAGGISIVEPDIECSNGIIHVIDEVLVPK